MSGRDLVLGAIGAVALMGCQSLGSPVPAVLASADADTMAKLKTALATAMGQAHVELGPGDPTRSSTLSVLPRPPGPPEDRSLAIPTIFRLEMEAGACFVVREDGGARARIEGVACRPA
ncbi:MAG: hypothetical protein QM773_11380 [Hyphomonadaceae bacterium]